MTTRRHTPTPAPAATLTDAELASRLRLGVARLARRLRQEATSGLTPSQLSALASTERHGPLPLSELADVERVARPTVTRIAKVLEAEGLVARAPDPTDGRVWLLRATDEGRALLRENRRRRDAWLAVRLRSLDADDRARLAAAVDVLDAVVEGEP